MKNSKTLVALIVAGLAIAAAAHAGDNPGAPAVEADAKGAGRHRPPPEAIDACRGKSSGAACSFIGRQKEDLTGSCFTPPAGAPGQATGQIGTPKAAAQGTPPAACRPDRDRPGR